MLAIYNLLVHGMLVLNGLKGRSQDVLSSITFQKESHVYLGESVIQSVHSSRQFHKTDWAFFSKPIPPPATQNGFL